MHEDVRNRFSAADPALGYLYQVRSALLWALQYLKSNPQFLVSIETLDDVTFEDTNATPIELLQTKHHRNATASLTDHSPDLWKTLRIWFDGAKHGAIAPTTSLALVTTGTAVAGSAVLRLRKEGRDVAAAKQLLDSVASSSQHKNNAAAYAAYLAAPDSARVDLLECVVVLDAAPMISSLDAELKREVFWAAGKKDHEAFLERLEGWWLRRVIKQLTGGASARIGSVELESQMGDLREQFKQESLPIDDDLLDFSLDEATRRAHEESTFVRQLEIINTGQSRIAAAIRDYYRAFAQRSRWLRQDLVVDLELNKYERRLVEEWKLAFGAMRDDLGDATDDAKKLSARGILKWAEQTQFSIRANVTEPFICRGSFHMLADERRVGWHPEFRDRLAQLLTSSEASG